MGSKPDHWVSRTPSFLESSQWQTFFPGPPKDEGINLSERNEALINVVGSNGSALTSDSFCQQGIGTLPNRMIRKSELHTFSVPWVKVDANQEGEKDFIND
jgi:hypothetical protein